MDLFFSSDALKRKNRKRKKNEDEDDDLLLRELERDVEVDSTRCEECGGTSFTEDESGTFFFSFRIETVHILRINDLSNDREIDM